MLLIVFKYNRGISIIDIDIPFFVNDVVDTRFSYVIFFSFDFIFAVISRERHRRGTC